MKARNNQATNVGVALVLIMGGLFGCSSTSSGPGGMGDNGGDTYTGVPQWTFNRGAAFSGEREVFYGVGNTDGIQHSALRRRSAEAAARRDLANIMNVYVAGLFKEYLANTTAGNMEAASVEQHVEDVTKQVTDATLVGSQIVQYWENPKNPKQAYALARLDLEQFLKTMEKYESAMDQFKDLDAEIKESVKKNARHSFGELNQELEKKRKN